MGILASLALACGGGGGDNAAGGGGDDGGPGYGDGGGPGSSRPGDGGLGDEVGNLGGDGSTVSDCPTGAALVYVVATNGALYSFDPSKLQFTKLGVPACQPNWAPYAMSVARDGYAWVLTSSGQLFRVSIQDLSCTLTSFASGQFGFFDFGMGFSSNGPNTQAETLFACSTNGLGWIDTTSLALTRIGAMPGLNLSQGCDLTGTGDGRLFAFVPQPRQWVVAQIDKSTSAPMWTHLVTPPLPLDAVYATAFWGGDLYLFTAYDQAMPSSLWRHRPSDGSTVQIMHDVGGFTVIGAGESTCVPVTPPQ